MNNDNNKNKHDNDNNKNKRDNNNKNNMTNVDKTTTRTNITMFAVVCLCILEQLIKRFAKE